MLNAYFRRGDTTIKKSIPLSRHDKAVQKALDVISVRIQDPPSLSELASTVGLSRTYFSTIFRQVMGMGLREYLIQARLNKAKELLQYPELEIKEIAHQVGFKDPGYLCRIFKMKTGQNPTQWRLMNIQEAKKL